MKFSSKEDVEAPIAIVFAMLSEFDSYERAAMRRGADVNRVGEHDVPHEGQTWEASFDVRGKERQARIELFQYTPPTEMIFESRSGGITTQFTIDLVPLAPNRTRISVEFDIQPRTLPARLFVQSIKLAKSNLTKRVRLNVAEYIRDLEERYKRTA